MAVIEVSDPSVKLAALVAPNQTDVVSARCVPVIVTLVPPAGGPFFTEILLTAGRGPVGTGGTVNSPGAVRNRSPMLVVSSSQKE
jgi:hypothetical protein